MEAILFFLIPISSCFLVFLKDHNRVRKLTTNALLIGNAVFFLIPIMLAYFNTPTGESMWNENTGGGAYLWLYFLIFPISAIGQLTLLILKIVFASKEK